MAVLKQMINKLVYCVFTIFFTQIQMDKCGGPRDIWRSHTVHMWSNRWSIGQDLGTPSELEMQAVTVARWGAIQMENSFNKTPNQT